MLIAGAERAGASIPANARTGSGMRLITAAATSGRCALALAISAFAAADNSASGIGKHDSIPSQDRVRSAARNSSPAGGSRLICGRISSSRAATSAGMMRPPTCRPKYSGNCQSVAASNVGDGCHSASAAATRRSRLAAIR